MGNVSVMDGEILCQRYEKNITIKYIVTQHKYAKLAHCLAQLLVKRHIGALFSIVFIPTRSGCLYNRAATNVRLICRRAKE